MTTTCDTSVLVPVLLSWHVAHEQARAAVADVRVIPAHVLVETYSVLTRLPGPQRLDVGTAAAALAALPWGVAALPASDHRELVTELAAHAISGGASYDGLVAATARAHGLTLLSRDQRARRTYEALGARFELISVVS